MVDTRWRYSTSSTERLTTERLTTDRLTTDRLASPRLVRPYIISCVHLVRPPRVAPRDHPRPRRRPRSFADDAHVVFEHHLLPPRGPRRGRRDGGAPRRRPVVGTARRPVGALRDAGAERGVAGLRGRRGRPAARRGAGHRRRLANVPRVAGPARLRRPRGLERRLLPVADARRRLAAVAGGDADPGRARARGPRLRGARGRRRARDFRGRPRGLGIGARRLRLDAPAARPSDRGALWSFIRFGAARRRRPGDARPAGSRPGAAHAPTRARGRPDVRAFVVRRRAAAATPLARAGFLAPFDYGRHYVTPRPGRLVLFPAWLPHGVALRRRSRGACPAAAPRVSVSFNVLACLDAEAEEGTCLDPTTEFHPAPAAAVDAVAAVDAAGEPAAAAAPRSASHRRSLGSFL